MTGLRNMYPAWRVFIFGVEVTEDVTRCAVNFNDGRAPNSCEIELSSKDDKYIVTEADIKAMYDDVDSLDDLRFPDTQEALTSVFDEIAARALGGDGGGDLDALAKAADARNRDARAGVAARAEHIDRMVRQRLDAVLVQGTVKRDVLSAKVVVRQEVSDAPAPSGNVAARGLLDLPALLGQALRYPFRVGDCVFHSNDPVRVFWRDPANPADWYYAFTGYVSDWTDAVDMNQARRVRIRCDDPTRPLRYARVATNPGVFDIRDAATAADATSRTAFSQGFANMTLPEFMFTLMFGSDVAGTTGRVGTAAVPAVRPFAYQRVGVSGVTDDVVSPDGIGAFNFASSVIAIAGPDAEQDSGSALSEALAGQVVRIDGLWEWQALLDHKVQRSDLINMARTELGRIVAELRTEELTRIEDIIGEIGAHPERYPIDGGRLMMLLPASLGPETNRDLLIRDIATSIATHTTWKSRLQLIYDVTERINFSFYASPRGDVICEMPLYDFDPTDFGEEPVYLPALRDKLNEVAWEFGNEEQRGPYAPQFRVTKADTIAWERTFSDANVRTQMIVNWSLVAARTDTQSSIDIGQQDAVNLRALWPAFGVRSEVMEPNGIISSQEAALLYGAVKLNMVNADALSAHYEVVSRVQWMWPNRPLEFTGRPEIACVRAANHSIVWNESVTCGLEVNYVRGWSGQTVPGESGPRPVYEPIGGFASSELNYAVRWGLLPDVESTKRR